MHAEIVGDRGRLQRLDDHPHEPHDRQDVHHQTPYSSSHLTAEWIEERPTLISTGGTRLAPLPKLTQPRFDLATTNGAAAALDELRGDSDDDLGGWHPGHAFGPRL